MSAPREIRRMNEAQFRRARKLISHLCANCDGGNCLPPAHFLFGAVPVFCGRRPSGGPGAFRRHHGKGQPETLRRLRRAFRPHREPGGLLPGLLCQKGAAAQGGLGAEKTGWTVDV